MHSFKDHLHLIAEFVSVAKNAAKEAISKKMSHDDAKDHVYKTTMTHAKKSSPQGAGGMVTRMKINSAIDKAEAHLEKHYGKN
tara:strand:+ start:119 stop:367 length:249 start_codon:yes stop_codon:yes gene_type:complete